jgi:hypothetical protein
MAFAGNGPQLHRPQSGLLMKLSVNTCTWINACFN